MELAISRILEFNAVLKRPRSSGAGAEKPARRDPAGFLLSRVSSVGPKDPSLHPLRRVFSLQDRHATQAHRSRRQAARVG